jgi:hypothetical protein
MLLNFVETDTLFGHVYFGVLYGHNKKTSR